MSPSLPWIRGFVGKLSLETLTFRAQAKEECTNVSRGGSSWSVLPGVGGVGGQMGG